MTSRWQWPAESRRYVLTAQARIMVMMSGYGRCSRKSGLGSSSAWFMMRASHAKTRLNITNVCMRLCRTKGGNCVCAIRQTPTYTSAWRYFAYIRCMRRRMLLARKVHARKRMKGRFIRSRPITIAIKSWRTLLRRNLHPKNKLATTAENLPFELLVNVTRGKCWKLWFRKMLSSTRSPTAAKLST